MKVLFFDIVGGIAGDMTAAALLDLGVPLASMQLAIQQLGMENLHMEAVKESRHQISGTRFVVTCSDFGEVAEHPVHGQNKSHHQAHHHRTYREIKALIDESSLAEGVKQKALAIFAVLAKAEGQVHGVSPEDVTFHEVGAWDSIADIVAVAVGLEALKVEAVYCSAVPLGSGTINTAHGVMPVPAPATLALLTGFPVVHGGPAFERTTPTGAAILAALASPVPEAFSYTPRQIGVGLGTWDDPALPNMLRVVLGTEEGTELSRVSHTAGNDKPIRTAREFIGCSEANLDDTNPEWIGFLVEQLMEAGALDVALVPIQMKKNRPGTQIQVLHPLALGEVIREIILSETTTLGVRYKTVERVVLPREPFTVVTPWGDVAGKVARIGEGGRFTPEYESCASLSRRTGIPLQEIYFAAQQAFSQLTHAEKI